MTDVFAHRFRGPIIGVAGKTIGSVSVKPDKDGLIVALEVSGLTQGEHAIHLHENGPCNPPDFATSGAHWNTQGAKHGTDNPQGPHDGDWDNLEIAADGHGSSDRLIPRWHHKVPETGLSLVIHEGRDDEVTNAHGRSGKRIACGVVIPPA